MVFGIFAGITLASCTTPGAPPALESARPEETAPTSEEVEGSIATDETPLSAEIEIPTPEVSLPILPGDRGGDIQAQPKQAPPRVELPEPTPVAIAEEHTLQETEESEKPDLSLPLRNRIEASALAQRRLPSPSIRDVPTIAVSPSLDETPTAVSSPANSAQVPTGENRDETSPSPQEVGSVLRSAPFQEAARASSSAQSQEAEDYTSPVPTTQTAPTTPNVQMTPTSPTSITNGNYRVETPEVPEVSNRPLAIARPEGSARPAETRAAGTPGHNESRRPDVSRNPDVNSDPDGVGQPELSRDSATARPAPAVSSAEGVQTSEGDRTAVAGERIEVRLPGRSWLFLGSDAPVDFLGRSVTEEPIETVFAFRVVGESTLRFASQDAVSGERMRHEETIALSHVPGDSIQRSDVVVLGDEVRRAGQPMTPGEEESKAMPTNEALLQYLRDANAPFDEVMHRRLIESVERYDSSAAGDSSALIEVPTDAWIAYTQRIANMGEVAASQRLLLALAESPRFANDEVIFRLAQTYETDSEARDIRKARDLYRLIESDYPFSRHYQAAGERIRFLNRHFFYIR